MLLRNHRKKLENRFDGESLSSKGTHIDTVRELISVEPLLSLLLDRGDQMKAVGIQEKHNHVIVRSSLRDCCFQAGRERESKQGKVVLK